MAAPRQHYVAADRPLPAVPCAGGLDRAVTNTPRDLLLVREALVLLRSAGK